MASNKVKEDGFNSNFKKKIANLEIKNETLNRFFLFIKKNVLFLQLFYIKINPTKELS